MPRQQLNDVTAFLDASVVYGSHKERSNKLRSFEKGRLKSVHSEGLVPVAGEVWGSVIQFPHINSSRVVTIAVVSRLLSVLLHN